MSQNVEMTINRLPAPTYNWLHLNEVQMGMQLPTTGGQVKANVPAVYAQVEKTFADFKEIETGMGRDIDALLNDGTVEKFFFQASADNRNGEDETITLDFLFEGTQVNGDFIGIETAENATLDIVMDFRAEAEGKAIGAAVIQTKVKAAKNSLTRIVQIHRAGSEYTILNDTGAVCEDGARVEIIHVVLDGRNNLIGARTDLIGRESSLAMDTGYIVQGDHRLDINYIANHFGKKTLCDINTEGVLRDEAHKVFRGTIDFKNGSAGAKGNEKEDVLLMDDNVVNKTIPLILCAEEDVEGNHGATIGQLDEDTLFYMETRGISRDEVYALMEKARLVTVIEKIPNESKRAELLELMEVR